MTPDLSKLKLSGREGWICPVCKSGVSPSSARCPCVSQSKESTAVKVGAGDGNTYVVSNDASVRT
jgi:hypothetical protein